MNKTQKGSQSKSRPRSAGPLRRPHSNQTSGWLTSPYEEALSKKTINDLSQKTNSTGIETVASTTTEVPRNFFEEEPPLQNSDGRTFWVYRAADGGKPPPRPKSACSTTQFKQPCIPRDRDAITVCSEETASTASTRCPECVDGKRREVYEDEIKRMRKRIKDLEEELKNKDFVNNNIQRNLQNMSRVMAADRQELVLLKNKKENKGDVGKLKDDLKQSETDRTVLQGEVQILKKNNLFLQEKVHRLREELLNK